MEIEITKSFTNQLKSIFMKIFDILFVNGVNSFMSEVQIKKLFCLLNGLNTNYSFEIIDSGSDLISPQQVAYIDIVVCNGVVFDKHNFEIKMITKKNPNLWFVVVSHLESRLVKAKENGAKHCLLFRKRNKDFDLTDLLYKFIIEEYLDSSDKILGAGFNN
jgi:hypothetical protein